MEMLVNNAEKSETAVLVVRGAGEERNGNRRSKISSAADSISVQD
jgi:hypothetical protein